jgi:hypothetical protein
MWFGLAEAVATTSCFGPVAIVVQAMWRRPWPQGLLVLYWGLLPIAIISTDVEALSLRAPVLPAYALAGGRLTLPLLVAHTLLRKLATRGTGVRP